MVFYGLLGPFVLHIKFIACLQFETENGINDVRVRPVDGKSKYCIYRP